MRGRSREIAARLWYRLARCLVALILRTVFHLEVAGAELVPREGPLILASNHRSYMDPPVVGVACPRPVHFMGKESLFKHKLPKILLSSLGAFPVDRGRIDRKAIGTALGLLRSGQVLGIFPEGTRGGAKPGTGQQGTSWLSLRTGCPIVPVAVSGTDRIMPDGILSFRPRRLTVRFGEPIRPSEGTPRRDVLTSRLMSEISDLLPAERRQARGNGG